MFDHAPVVVLAGADPAAQLEAASLAVVLGAPALAAAGASAAAEDVLAAELDRLGTTTVLAVGDVTGWPVPAPEGDEPSPSPTGRPDVDVVAAPDDLAGLATVLGVEPVAGAAVEAGGEVAAVAALDGATPTVLGVAASDAAAAAATAAPTGDDDGTSDGALPPLAATAPVPGLVVLSDGGAAQVLAVGTARAAGARVLPVPGGDPRGSSEVIQALAAQPPTTVVALGPAFGSADLLGPRVATAATGVELPGGTQLLFNGTRYVALYGTPGAPALGVLGEQGVPETIARAEQHAAALQPYSSERVVPALEVIATVASAGAGPDGNYSAERPVSELRPLVDAAREAGQYVVLDLQPGRTDFLTQARQYEELLLEPHVGLALDPEWRLRPDQVHLRQIGSVGIDEVNQVVTYLADLTRDRRLPQKMLVLHQFALSMIQDRGRLDTSRSELALTIHVDGQGTQPAKNGTWQTLRRDAPPVHWGWKNFYDEDVPMLTPEQTSRVEPFPELVTYQ